ncbi:MAG: patatin [Deltaproteobacteria bacterium]|nr:patatin [Deltaproteobacteria bacterium]
MGSGAARGFASIGVLKALREMGVNPDFIAGTSMGALVGAFAATGKLEMLEEVVFESDWKEIVGFFSDIVFPRDGLIDGKRVESFIQKYTQDMLIEETDIPFRAVSTDIVTGEEVVLSEGKLMEAVRASISIPGIFTPVKKDGRFLVDGALVNPVPVTVVREMGADVVIAVDVNRYLFEGAKEKQNDMLIGQMEQKKQGGARLRLPGGKTLHLERIISSLSKKFEGGRNKDRDPERKVKGRQKGPNIFEILVTSGHIMGFHISQYMLDLHRPDVIITPKVGHIKLLELQRAKEAALAGYEATMEKREEIEIALKRRRRRKSIAKG